MAVRIRLKRFGTKKKPRYRIIVCDRRAARDSRAIDEIGYYDPTKSPPVITIEKETVQKWLSNGAIPTERVRNLLKRQKLI